MYLPSSDDPTVEDLKPLRSRIDDIDRAILTLLNMRTEHAIVIGHIKKKLGLPVYVPSREKDVVRNVMNANTGPLDSEAVKRLFERIIDENRALERRNYQEMSD